VRKRILAAAIMIALPAGTAIASDLPFGLMADSSSSTLSSPCWVEDLSSPPRATAAAATRARRKGRPIAKRHKAARRVAPSAHHRRAAHARIWVPKATVVPGLRWNCAPVEPAPWSLDPYSSDFADVMLPYRGDEDVQQWIIDRHRVRRHRLLAERIPAAPDVPSWLAMIVGFGLIGAALRHAGVSHGIGTFTHSAELRSHGISDLN